MARCSICCRSVENPVLSRKKETGGLMILCPRCALDEGERMQLDEGTGHAVLDEEMPDIDDGDYGFGGDWWKKGQKGR